jgi:hypothetical protein
MSGEDELGALGVVGIVVAGAVVGLTIFAAAVVWSGAELVARTVEALTRRRSS